MDSVDVHESCPSMKISCQQTGTESVALVHDHQNLEVLSLPISCHSSLLSSPSISTPGAIRIYALGIGIVGPHSQHSRQQNDSKPAEIIYVCISYITIQYIYIYYNLSSLHKLCIHADSFLFPRLGMLSGQLSCLRIGTLHHH